MKRPCVATLTAVFFLVVGPICFGSLSSSATSLKPTETGFKLSPSIVGSGGGTVLLSARVTNATKCIMIVSPAIPGFAYNHVCSSGVISYKANLPKNTVAAKKSYSFRLEVIGRAGQKTIISPIIKATVNAGAGSSSSGGGGSSGNGGSSTGPASTVATISVPAEPDALLQVGNDIWVASCSGNALTEIDASSYTVVNQITGNGNFQFGCPDALAYDNGYIWVANRSTSTLMQFNASNGAWLQTQTGSYISYPDAIVSYGSDIWIANSPPYGDGSLVEFDATTGSELNSTHNTIQSSISDPGCIAVVGSDLWASDSGSGFSYEFSAINGSYIRPTSGMSGSSILCLSYYGGYIWDTSSNNNKVIEYNAITGKYVREFTVVNPEQIIATGSYIFVVGVYPYDAVYQYTTSGVLVRTIVIEHTGNLYSYGLAILNNGNSLWVANIASSSVSLYSF